MSITASKTVLAFILTGDCLKHSVYTDGGKWELPDLSAGGQIKIIIDPIAISNTGATKGGLN